MLARQVGYPCLSLHGGKDQSDRESTINDFKQDVCNLLVATSIAARGLDVKELVLVVNYDTPNHHEDYVHRVGRTGQLSDNYQTVLVPAPGFWNCDLYGFAQLGFLMHDDFLRKQACSLLSGFAKAVRRTDHLKACL